MFYVSESEHILRNFHWEELQQNNLPEVHFGKFNSSYDYMLVNDTIIHN